MFSVSSGRQWISAGWIAAPAASSMCGMRAAEIASELAEEVGIILLAIAGEAVDVPLAGAGR